MQVNQFKKSIKKIHGDNITYISDDSGYYVIAKCKFHGEYSVRRDSLLAGYGCSKCDGEKKRSKYKLSNKEVQARLDKSHKGNVIAVGEYVNQRTKLKFYCKKHDETWESILDTVVRGKGCPKCSMKAMLNKRAFAKKKYKLNGKLYSVMGYEPFAIDFIKSKGHAESDIVIDTNKIPIIQLANGKKHFPDIYVRSRNLLVEVKSPYTFFSTESLFNKLREKRSAAISSNFNYKVLLFNEYGSQVSLPKLWWKLDWAELSSRMKSRCRTFS